MSKSQRDKGAAGERELAALLSETLGVQIKRKLGAARDGGDDMEIGPFSIECKRHERVQIEAWLKQAEGNTEAGRIPVVCWRRSRGKWYAAVPLSDFMRLMGNEL